MDCAPHILELPLSLGVMTFGGIMLGMGGSEIRFWYKLRENVAGAVGNTFYVEDNGIRMVDFAVMILGAITFVWGIICIALGAKQFKGRKGNYSGEGTAAWLPVLLFYLPLLGAWTGVTSAYTAYANTRTWSLTAGPGYTGTLTEPQRYVLYQIGQALYSHVVPPIAAPDSFAQLGVMASTLAPWGETTTIEAANAATLRYLKYQFYKATVIVCWMTLSIVFTATVTHSALPLLLKCMGWTRQDKRNAEKKQREQQYNDYS